MDDLYSDKYVKRKSSKIDSSPMFSGLESICAMHARKMPLFNV